MEIVELGWSPLVTVIYVVWSLATARPLDYSLLTALIALSITCIVYARKVHRKPDARPEQPIVRNEPAAPAEPRPVEQRVEQRVEQKKEAVAAPKVEPKKEAIEPKQAARPEPRESRAAVSQAASQKELDETKAQLERSKQSAAALQSQVDEEAKHAAERLDLTLAIANVKERARAIRRQWPEAAFCQRPLRDQWWSPNATQTASAPWLGQAHEWLALFRETRAKFFPASPDDLYLRSLDLEEVLDLLDDVLLSRESESWHRETRVTAGTAPMLAITAWGAPEGENDKCGFWIQNSGEIPASNIQLVRAPIGSKVLSIFLPPSQSLTKDQRLFAIATLTGAQRVTAYNLEDLMRKLPGNGINGAKPLGIPLRLIYDSTDGVRYSSRHEMTMEDTGIKIGYVNTEMMAMPL